MGIGELEVEIRFNGYSHEYSNHARLYLIGPFLKTINAFLKEKDPKLNAMFSQDYFIMYHYPIIEELKPHAKGVIVTFFYTYMGEDNELFDFMKNVLHNKVCLTKWFAFFEIRKRHPMDEVDRVKPSQVN